jgi:HEXXH motif-containing protein
MKLVAHRVPTEVFADLSTGGGGVAAVRHLAAAQHSKQVLLVRAVRDVATATGHPQAAQAQKGYDLLAQIQGSDPEAVDAVLRHPPVAAWARRTVQALDRSATRAAAVPGQLAGLAAAAAIRSGTPCSVGVPADGGTVMLPSLGEVSGLSGPAEVRVGSSGTEVVAGTGRVRVPSDPHTDGPGWRGLRGLSTGTVRVLIDDLDPYRMPGTSNMGTRLTATEAGHWQQTLESGWELLVSGHPTVAEEVGAAITVFTPLIPPVHGQVSASSKETFGCVAMSGPPDGCSLAMTLAHEVQHNKLAALLDIVPLLGPDTGRRYYAPWRDDPRPLSGLLQGAYAHLGVTAFWRRQRAGYRGEARLQAQAEFTRWRQATELVTGTLTASGRLTGPGEIFLAGMTRTLREWSRDPVPAAARELARREADEHLARWRDRNGTPG